MRLLLLCLALGLFSCQKSETQKKPIHEQYIVILGTAQDGGYPHIGCEKQCCKAYYDGKQTKKRVVSIGLVDKTSNQRWLFEATPDLTSQITELNNHIKNDQIVDGVFLTHAHMGHYTGLMFFGREALGRKNVPVYAMPKMKTYLENHGPWSQLVNINNIALQSLQQDSTVVVSKQLKVTPFLVPHRDEYSETVGYKIVGPEKSALFIPDIDKWYKWKRSIIEEVKKVDYAFLDASFFKDGEINRPMSEIPHPFTTETVDVFKNESYDVKTKVIFIHFNHSNPALQPDAIERVELEAIGFRFADEGQIYKL